ncbi:MAG: glutamate synthase large subunit [Candidatus Ancillula sp.]|jgi:glutamate synthase (NADPH/NADH) large chain|nr:glutamate synthase large subunit [Candidatus Ancillula sp.]
MTNGLYNTREEHENCGLAFIATLKKEPTRQIVEQGFEALVNLDHRGAVGADVNSGDGAGMLLSMPDEFLRSEFAKLDVTLPEPGAYAAGIAFLKRGQNLDAFKKVCKKEGVEFLGQREIEVDDSILGPTAYRSMPKMVQVAVKSASGKTSTELDQQVYRVRKICQNQHKLYFASLSSKTITYKGMLTTMQLPKFFKDLQQANFKAKIALVHSRFSTNTLPSWELAQPLRMVAHNGEINTIRGNRNWFNARQGKLRSDALSRAKDGNFSELFPILTPGASDSGSFDEALELLTLTGRSLPHSVLMMVPEAYENWNSNTLDDFHRRLKAFYDYNTTLIEPWDGPASLSWTDGEIIGSVLDRNGLRPGRFWVTDEIVVMASEVGVLNSIDKAKIVRKGRLEPGRMLLVDTTNGRIVENDEIKDSLASMHPYQDWLTNAINLDDLPKLEHIQYPSASIHRRQRSFGYTEEEVKMLLTPMAQTGKEPLGAMGTDTPIAVLSKRPKLLFDYFTQDFAQVTNPPLDSIREKIVTSIVSAIGPEPNLLEDSATHAKKILLPFPVLNNDEFASIEAVGANFDLDSMSTDFKCVKIRGLFRAHSSDPTDTLRKRLYEIFDEVDDAIKNGCNIIILSDRNADSEFAPIPSLLLTSAVQHHLIKMQTRTSISLIVEAGDVRETHHIALLIGFGAAAVNPYLAMESVEFLANSDAIEQDAQTATDNLIKALGNGVLKIMSKMGISTIMSYRGSQIFGAVGLSKELVDEFFTGTTTKIGGINLGHVANEILMRHKEAYRKKWTSKPHEKLRTGGEYKWRKTGEEHLFDPKSIFYLQQAVENRDYDTFKKYSAIIDDNASRLMTIRSMFEILSAKDFGRRAISVDEVEPVSEIVKRFSTGAMSFGSISREAHETLAIAMNRLGARSNSGEGGEEPDRIYDPERRSRIKQVASGRFGVTSEYLNSASDIQIKLAQGAKPGEGGHLPGEKVYPWVARTRHSTPGIDLVSPPPHHDIYSIEDLAQLIHDLKMANPEARVHVKLVSEYGVGTIAAGVSKAHADVVLISGADGGTGAAPLSSIKHAGQPWEIGLAETVQSLVQSDLRDRIVVQVDGQLKTGRDVIIAALLGAEEFGFATAPLVAEGCVMMRVCNKNTCPVGVATQDPELRKNYNGKVENVVNFFEFIAQEVREMLAELGFKTLAEAVGNVEYLQQRENVDSYKANTLDLSGILEKPVNFLRENAPLVQTKLQQHDLEKSLDARLLPDIDLNTLRDAKQFVKTAIRNVDRSFGTLIGHEITLRFNQNYENVLDDDALTIELEGEAGQSFGAFIPNGVTLRLVGDANDYVAKGLSGGKIYVSPMPDANFDPHTNIISGNVLGFGATSGEAYFAGVVGERFAVRNSGATLIAEGAGDHALEYMTGGTVMILGDTGRNLGAGFLGGVAYILDLDYSKVNAQALASGELQFVPFYELDANEQLKVSELVADFAQKARSDFAQMILNNNELGRLTKIVPKKYEEIVKIEDAEENWSKILEIASA